jgi:hypothetical protein
MRERERKEGSGGRARRSATLRSGSRAHRSSSRRRSHAHWIRRRMKRRARPPDPLAGGRGRRARPAAVLDTYGDPLAGGHSLDTCGSARRWESARQGEGGRAAGPAVGGERSVVPFPATPPHLSGVGRAEGEERSRERPACRRLWEEGEERLVGRCRGDRVRRGLG